MGDEQQYNFCNTITDVPKVQDKEERYIQLIREKLELKIHIYSKSFGVKTFYNTRLKDGIK